MATIGITEELTMHDPVKTHVAITKRSTAPLHGRSPSTRRTRGTATNMIQHRRAAVSRAKPEQKSFATKRLLKAHNAPKAAENQASVTDFVEEVTIAARQVILEGYHAVVAIYKTVTTLGRLVVQSTNLVLALAGLTLAVGSWVFATGKSIWAKLSD